MYKLITGQYGTTKAEQLIVQDNIWNCEEVFTLAQTSYASKPKLFVFFFLGIL
jgi:hypothetical protein